MSERADWRHNEITNTNTNNKGGPAAETLSQARNVFKTTAVGLLSYQSQERCWSAAISIGPVLTFWDLLLASNSLFYIGFKNVFELAVA